MFDLVAVCIGPALRYFVHSLWKGSEWSIRDPAEVTHDQGQSVILPSQPYGRVDCSSLTNRYLSQRKTLTSSFYGLSS